MSTTRLRAAISDLQNAVRAECRDGPKAPVEEAQAEVDSAIEELIDRLAKIDAKFTEREKTVRMGRDPAAEARAMRDDPPTIGDLAYVGRVLVTEGVADIAMDRARVGKALGDGRHRLYAVKPDPAFPIDPALIAAGRLHHSKETTPEALLSRVGDVWERAGFNSETSDFLRDISDYLSAIVAERGAA